jgi:hypothetical protein
MTINELIKVLQKECELHGDIPVKVYDCTHGDTSILEEDIEVLFDTEGNTKYVSL